jgi:hypothetical protein
VHSITTSSTPVGEKALTSANWSPPAKNPGFAFQQLSLINMHQASILILLCRAPRVLQSPRYEADERRWEGNLTIMSKKDRGFLLSVEVLALFCAFCGSILSLYQSVTNRSLNLAPQNVPPPTSSSHSALKQGLSIPGCGGIHFRRPR